MQRLARVIELNGFRNPLVISKRSGYLVKGEGRLLASFSLGLNVVPVEYQDYATDEEEYSDLIADNKVAELSERDREELKAVVSMLGNNDKAATGFSSSEIDSLMGIMAAQSDREENLDTESWSKFCTVEGETFTPSSYIDDLIKNEVGDRVHGIDTYFDVTFCFEEKYSKLKDYIKENGKKELEQVILKAAGVI